MSIAGIAAQITEKRATIPPNRAGVIGISGIDGSGKGFVAGQIADKLRTQSLAIAVIGADGWLNLPSVRFNEVNPGLHFYQNALRLEQMFDEVVMPLREKRAFACEVNHLIETASAFEKRTYNFEAVDIILVEGIFILKPDYRRHFDLKIWIDCSFETALERAIRRGQEGLSREQTVAAYEKVYFPAQRIHFERDQPREIADIIFCNDDRSAFAAVCRSRCNQQSGLSCEA